MDTVNVKKIVSGVILTTETASQLSTVRSKQRTPLTELCMYEDISDNDCNDATSTTTATPTPTATSTTDTHPYEDVSDTDFDEWLDTMLEGNTTSVTSAPVEPPQQNFLELIANDDIGDDPDVHVELPEST